MHASRAMCCYPSICSSGQLFRVLLIILTCIGNNAHAQTDGSNNARELLLGLWQFNGIRTLIGAVRPIENLYKNETQFVGDGACTLESVTRVYDAKGIELENINFTTVDFSESAIQNIELMTVRGWWGSYVLSPEDARTVRVQFTDRPVKFVVESEKYPSYSAERLNKYLLFYADDGEEAQRIADAVNSLGKECLQ